jgi:TPR repeat protein
MKLAWLTAAFLAVSSGGATAANLADGVEAYGNGDDARAFAIFSELAATGDPAAEHLLGKMYLEGRGTAANIEVASKWLSEAAKKGDSKSAYLLGNIAEEQKDRVLALNWYKRAADTGDDRAMAALGVIYQDPENPQQNVLQAVEWFTKAAKLGNASAAYNLGVIYTKGREKGQGPKKNTQTAEKWFKQAAEGGHLDAQYNLGVMYLDRGEISEAAKWFKSAAGRAEPQAQFILATMYAAGDGVEKNLVEALAWHDLAAQKGAGNLELRRYLAEAMTPQQIDQAEKLVAERARAESEAANETQ